MRSEVRREERSEERAKRRADYVGACEVNCMDERFVELYHQEGVCINRLFAPLCSLPYKALPVRDRSRRSRP